MSTIIWLKAKFDPSLLDHFISYKLCRIVLKDLLSNIDTLQREKYMRCGCAGGKTEKWEPDPKVAPVMGVPVNNNSRVSSCRLVSYQGFQVHLHTQSSTTSSPQENILPFRA